MSADPIDYPSIPIVDAAMFKSLLTFALAFFALSQDTSGQKKSPPKSASS